MKKLIIYLSIIVGLFVILFAVNQLSEPRGTDNPYGINASKLKSETRAQLNNPHYQNIIVPDQLEKQLSDKESLFVYYFSPTCSHCVRTTPILMPIADEVGVYIHQLNLWEFNSSWNEYKIEFTPTLVYYKNGVEADRMVGGIAETADQGNTAEQYKQFLLKYK